MLGHKIKWKNYIAYIMSDNRLKINLLVKQMNRHLEMISKGIYKPLNAAFFIFDFQLFASFPPINWLIVDRNNFFTQNIQSSRTD